MTAGRGARLCACRGVACNRRPPSRTSLPTPRRRLHDPPRPCWVHESPRNWAGAPPAPAMSRRREEGERQNQNRTISAEPTSRPSGRVGARCHALAGAVGLGAVARDATSEAKRGRGRQLAKATVPISTARNAQASSKPCREPAASGQRCRSQVGVRSSEKRDFVARPPQGRP